jgi:hypothetical protein
VKVIAVEPAENLPFCVSVHADDRPLGIQSVKDPFDYRGLDPQPLKLGQLIGFEVAPVEIADL